jgi:hypothetical protein
LEVVGTLFVDFGGGVGAAADLGPPKFVSEHLSAISVLTVNFRSSRKGVVEAVGQVGV